MLVLLLDKNKKSFLVNTDVIASVDPYIGSCQEIKSQILLRDIDRSSTNVKFCSQTVEEIQGLCIPDVQEERTSNKPGRPKKKR